MMVPQQQSYNIPTQLFINGKFVDSHSKDRHSLFSPIDDSLFCDKVQYASAEDVDAAVDAAQAALRGPWKSFTAAKRGEVLLQLADLMEKHKEELAWLDGEPIGKPTAFANVEMAHAARNLRYYAGWADKLAGESYPADDGFVKIVRHEPLGVCAGISPWNGPWSSLTSKLGPALATGNVMILKPSEKTPFGSGRFAALATEAGIVPPGVIQSLPGAGATGSLLATHMGVRKIGFTGSIATGRKVQVAAANSNFKRVTLELGGKSPAAIFDDCNLDNAVHWATMAITMNTGQACVAASRVYVQEGIADKFISAYVNAMQGKAKTLDGDMSEAGATGPLGPLADKAQLARVSSFFEEDLGNTQILTGGKRHGEIGCFWEPTVLLNPDPSARLYREEIFGPVACVCTFKDEADLLRMANNSEYGLMAGVFTQDVSRAMRIAAELDSGVVGINCVSYPSIQVPFGGSKQSGIGRENGQYALRAYTEPKSVIMYMQTPFHM